jgi:hypothetical protein
MQKDTIRGFREYEKVRHSAPLILMIEQMHEMIEEDRTRGVSPTAVTSH